MRAALYRSPKKVDDPTPTGYAGPRLPAGVRDLLRRLASERFAIRASGKSKKTIIVSDGERDVGYVNTFVMQHNALMGYHFKLTDGYEGNACPPGFSLAKFAVLNGCLLEELEPKLDKDKVYLHVLSERAGVALARAARGDAPDAKPDAGRKASRVGTDWTVAEVEASVADYLAMLSLELAGAPFSKAAHRRALLAKLPARSEQSIEFKHANVRDGLRKSA